MPFIDTKLNFRLPREKETVLKAKLGEAIAAFPGKSEYWLMLNFEDECRLWFRGYDQYPTAMVKVELLGSPDRSHCEEMTKIICRIFKEELNVAPDHVYVQYTFTDQWGWNGENF